MVWKEPNQWRALVCHILLLISTFVNREPINVWQFDPLKENWSCLSKWLFWGQDVVDKKLSKWLSFKNLLIIPGPLLKRKLVQVAPRPGNNWSAAWNGVSCSLICICACVFVFVHLHNAIPVCLWWTWENKAHICNKASIYGLRTKQIWLKKLRISSSVLSEVIQLSVEDVFERRDNVAKYY